MTGDVDMSDHESMTNEQEMAFTPDQRPSTPAAASTGSADRAQTGWSPRQLRLAGGLVAVESLLILVPLVILGRAIEWPASLDDPAAVALPRLLENEVAVRTGYLVYLAYSVLFLPVAALVTVWLHRVGGRVMLGTTTLIAIGMAAVSTLARSIGITRWLTTAFPLAEAWTVGDSTDRAAIAVQFEAVNNYGGAIGEILGVSLFAALWLGLSVLTPGAGGGRRWVVVGGAIVTVLVSLPLVELAGIDAGILVTVGGTGFVLWLLAVGLAMVGEARTAG